MSERSGQRMDVAVGVIVRHGGQSEPCMSRTVGQRGMFIATRRTYPLGTVLGVEIVHQDLRIAAQARVAVATGSGVGLEFLGDAHSAQLDGLLRRFVPKTLTDDARVDVDALQVYWSLSPTDEPKHFWRHRRHKVRLIDLSLDGAAFVDKKPPEVGEALTVALPNPLADGSGDLVEAAARVVRHTERGFAVAFVTPSQSFRRAVSEIRKAARAGDGD